jgi:hypothetical protein
MAGRPKKCDSESVSFAVYKKTWLILKDLEHQSLKRSGESKSLKEIVHDAVDEYSKTVKQKA